MLDFNGEIQISTFLHQHVAKPFNTQPLAVIPQAKSLWPAV